MAICVVTEFENSVVGTSRGVCNDHDIIYPALGLAGESGELVDQVKKAIRDDHIYSGGNMTEERKKNIVDESGDVLFYLARLLLNVGSSLEESMRFNIIKREERYKNK